MFKVYLKKKYQRSTFSVCTAVHVKNLLTEMPCQIVLKKCDADIYIAIY